VATVTFNEAISKIHDAAKEAFDADPRVQAIGVAGDPNRAHYRAVRNTAAILPMATNVRHASEYGGIDITYVDARNDVEAHVKLPSSGPGSPTAASLVPEQHRRRPLVCGLQIENYDDDVRTQVIAGGHIIVGTLGCFVRTPDGSIAILSNNHVVAGENRGLKGTDRICQPFGQADAVSGLTDYVALRPSPLGARPAQGNVVFNDVDAGIAALNSSIGHAQGYLPARTGLKGPTGTSAPANGIAVFKVGRTTGLTYGEITDVGTIVGPIGYAPGPVWFQNCFTVEGLGGTMFSDHGDSGSAIIEKATGAVLGLLFAGNGQQTYACPISSILTALNCTMA